MELQYLKLNNRKFEFDKTINVFMANENTGKSSIYTLIKFIYGERLGSRSSLYSLIRRISVSYHNYLIEWKFKKVNSIYSLNCTTKLINVNNSYEIKIFEYSKHFNNKFIESLTVLDTKRNMIDFFSFDDNIVKQLNSPTNYGKFLIQNVSSSTYTAITVLGILNENKLKVEQENFFANVGKKINLEKSRDNSKKIIEVNEKLIENYSKEHDFNIIKKYTELEEIRKKKMDEQLFLEIEILCENITGYNVGKIKDFHNMMVDSYNEVVREQRKIITEQNPYIQEYNQKELKRLMNYKAINADIEEDLHKVNEYLKMNKENIDEVEFEEINSKIEKYTKTFNEKLGVINKYINSFVYEYDEKLEVNRQLILDLRPIDSELTDTGGSFKNINFIGFISYLLLMSDFPVLLLEKTFFSENPNIIIPDILNLMSSEFKNKKQLIVTFHPDEELSVLGDSVCDLKVFSCSENYFGISF